MSTSTKTSVRILEGVTPDLFDSVATHPMQTYAWGEARSATGVRVMRFGEYAGDCLCATYQMTIHRIPHTSLNIGYIPRSCVPSSAVVAFIQTWARTHRVVFVKWEPYVSYTEGEDSMTGLSGMRRSAHPLFTEWNLELDLSGSEESLYSGFRKNVRSAIRLAERSGVTVVEMSTDAGFEIFADLYFGTVQRQAYHGHTRGYHRKIWNAMHAGGMARIFVAFYNGVPHSAFEIFFCKERAYYPYSGSSNVDKHIPSTQLLMWEVIRTAKREGMKVLDLWGSLAPEYQKSHPWAGFTYFKQGFGSQFIHMTRSHDLVVMPVLYHLYSFAYMLRKRFWGSRGL